VSERLAKSGVATRAYESHQISDVMQRGTAVTANDRRLMRLGSARTQGYVPFIFVVVSSDDRDVHVHDGDRSADGLEKFVRASIAKRR
jgi:hypothetical protein